MTDGNTGFHVAPITEEDMFKVRDILQRAADAIVGMSQLSADVDMLRSTVTSLQADTDRLRSQNNALDEALNYSRKARDEQAAKLEQVTQDLRATEAERNIAVADLDKAETTIEQYHNDLEAARKAKDDAEFRVLELEDKLKATEEVLDSLRKHFADITKIFQPAATPEPPLTEPSPSTVSVPISEPVYGASPEPFHDIRPESRDDWDTGYYWDPNTLKYWRVGVTPRADGEAIPF